MGVNLSRQDRGMPESLLDGEDVRGSTVKVGSEGVAERVWVNLLGDVGLGNPFLESALDLTGGNPFETLTDKQGRAVESHLATLFQKLMQCSPRLAVEESGDDLTAFALNENPFLDQVDIAPGRADHSAITRKPYFKATFISGTTIYFRPGGDYGKAFRSLHVNRVWVDEAAWLLEPAWRAVRQCLNAGGRFRVYSNPNGHRDSTYYHLTKDGKKWHLFQWPSSLNPSWSDEREQDMLDFYGGRDTPGFLHEVLVEHGSPSFGAFNQEQFKLSQKDYDGYRFLKLTGEELSDCDGEEAGRRGAGSSAGHSKTSSHRHRNGGKGCLAGVFGVTE